MSTGKRGRVCIVVLGDVGRSPRMQYHAMSFLKEGFDVELIGYKGSQPMAKLLQHKNMKLNYLYSCPEFKNFLPSVLAYTVKVMWQVITLFLALVTCNLPDFIIVQNPPAVPVLGVIYIVCKIFRSKFIIDWHNYAYTILSMSLGEDHALVKISKWFEFYFGKKSDANLCVTKAMREDLLVNHEIRAIVFYDRPPEFFRETTVEKRHTLFSKLGIEHGIFLEGCKNHETIFTRCPPNSSPVLREDRPALIVSSTSWTEDEDFSVLLNALEEYEKAKSHSDTLPPLICAITGKGPLKEFYRGIIKGKNWKFVKVITPWLEAEEYPLFVGSADLGVSLHRSSSGLDLPMKVVDMFGCLVPVCSINYKCISELVDHKKTGYIFNDSDEFFHQLKELFYKYPCGRSSVLKHMKDNIKIFRSLKWHDNWTFNVLPIFTDTE